MSYILDALKKAESDRKLGSVPNIHTHTIVAAESERSTARWVTRWMWAAFALLMSALLAIVWRQPWHTAPVAHSSATVPLSALPKVPDPGPSQPAAAEVRVPAPALPPTAETKRVEPAWSPPSAPKVPASAPSSTAIPAAVAATRLTPKSAPARPSGDKPAETRSPQPTATAAVEQPEKAVARSPELPRETPVAPEARVPNLRELPQNIQAEIPPLTITGYIYSKNDADRSVLINNKLLREGDLAAPGVVLEKMMPKEAILNYKGYRYRLAY